MTVRVATSSATTTRTSRSLTRGRAAAALTLKPLKCRSPALSFLQNPGVGAKKMLDVPTRTSNKQEKRGSIIGVTALRSQGVYAIAGSPSSPSSTKPPSRRSIKKTSDESCFPALVTVTNDADPDATKVSVSVVDFPGLLRVVAWVLNGLELVVQSANLSTVDGMASQEFYVTDLAGRQVQDTATLSERISQFVQHCAPDEEALQAKKFKEGRVVIDNQESENFTVISIDSGNRDGAGLLLSIASTISALGITILEANICTECGPELQHFSGGRHFRFLVHKIGGKKLDYVDASGALFTLNLIINSASSTPIHSSRLH